MVTILDIDEMTVLAQVRAEEWEREFQESFREPEIVIGLVSDYMQMSDDERAQWKEANPERYDKVERAMRRSPLLSKMTGGSYG